MIKNALLTDERAKWTGSVRCIYCVLCFFHPRRIILYLLEYRSPWIVTCHQVKLLIAARFPKGSFSTIPAAALLKVDNLECF